MKPGDKVTGVVIGSNGKPSQPTTVIVGNGNSTDPNHVPTAPVLNPVTPGSPSISGSGEPGGTVAITLPSGQVITRPIDKTGKFEVPVPDGTNLKPGDKVTGIVIGSNGKPSQPTTVVVGDTKKPSRDQIRPEQDGSKISVTPGKNKGSKDPSEISKRVQESPSNLSGDSKEPSRDARMDRVANKSTSPMDLATHTVRSNGEGTTSSAYSNLGKHLPNTGQEAELSLLAAATLAGLGAANLLVLKRRKDQE